MQPAFDLPVELTRADAGSASSVPTARFELRDARTPQQRTRDGVEWVLIAAALAAAYRQKLQAAALDAGAVLGLWQRPGSALAGTKLRLRLDIGREPGTWMPPTWGLSGRRVCFDVAVELRPDGVCDCLGVGAYIAASFSPGTWRVEGDTLRLTLVLNSELTRGDVTLPAGPLHLKTRAWGATVASRGNVLLLQSRWFIRREFRTAGTFRAEPLPEGDVAIALRPARTMERFTS